MAITDRGHIQKQGLVRQIVGEISDLLQPWRPSLRRAMIGSIEEA